MVRHIVYHDVLEIPLFELRPAGFFPGYPFRDLAPPEFSPRRESVFRTEKVPVPHQQPADGEVAPVLCVGDIAVELYIRENGILYLPPAGIHDTFIIPEKGAKVNG
jgi:hypothetical protein